MTCSNVAIGSYNMVRSIDSAFVPPVHSSPQLHSGSTSTCLQSQGTPIRPNGSSTSSLHGAPLQGKKHNMRTLIINANSVSDEQALLENVVEYTDPDVLIISETKLDATVDSTEFLTSGYRGDIRKDRQAGWGCDDCHQVITHCETPRNPDTFDTVWAKIMDKQNNPSALAHFIVGHMNIHQLRSLNWKK